MPYIQQPIRPQSFLRPSKFIVHFRSSAAIFFQQQEFGDFLGKGWRIFQDAYERFSSITINTQYTLYAIMHLCTRYALHSLRMGRIRFLGRILDNSAIKISGRISGKKI